MPRPSQNVDQRLLDAGLELLPQTGCAGLSVRRLTEHAGVNLGMFHYHFKSKDNFIRAVLQRTYEGMFAALTLEVETDPAASPVHNLRSAVRVLAHFGRRHRHLMVRILADAMAGEAPAREFLQANLPRHIAVIGRLIAQAQQRGEFRPAPPPQVLAFIAAAVASPILIGTAMQGAGSPPEAGALIDDHLLSDAAIEARIDAAVRAWLIPPEETP
jgi:AcrR family transcriptional regulator